MHPILDPAYRVVITSGTLPVPTNLLVEVHRLAAQAQKPPAQIVGIIVNLALPEILLQVAYELGQDRDTIERGLPENSP